VGLNNPLSNKLTIYIWRDKNVKFSAGFVDGWFLDTLWI
jgi:hypothetical protein